MLLKRYVTGDRRSATKDRKLIVSKSDTLDRSAFQDIHELFTFDVVIAGSMYARLRGLLSSHVCSKGEVLILAPCKSIHTFGMKEPIDVAFVDSEGQVSSCYCSVPSARVLKDQRAALVLERRSRFGGPWVKPGDRLV